jgi:uncharacterized membrane protein
VGLRFLGRTAVRAVPVAAVLWAILIVSTPLMGSMPSGAGVARLAGAAAYWTGATVCHQRPERSFHTHGVQWPVCARCSGLYLSAAFGILVTWARGRTRRAMAFEAWRTVLIAAAVPTAVSLVLEWWAPRLASGLARALAAAPLGAAVGVLLAASMSFRGRLEGCERTQSSE